mgnify:CR=1 FL=1
MKKLLVITEPNFVEETSETRNPALNQTLAFYKAKFEEVHCICPHTHFKINIEGPNGIVYHTLSGFTKSFFKKPFYRWRISEKEIKSIFDNVKPTVVQFRIPSFFTLSVYKHLKYKDCVLTTYIAGDWAKGVEMNYKKFFVSKVTGKILDILQKSIIRNTICVSAGQELAQKYKNINPDIHAYYSTSHTEAIKRSTFIKGTIRLTFIGRLEPLKRLEDLLSACNILKYKGLKFELKIIGDGIQRKNLEAIVDDLKLRSNVRFIGQIAKRSEVNNYLDNSDILVLPSLAEGSPKVLPESMARGVIPIAVKGTGSNNYIIEDSQNGFLVAPKSPNEIADAVIKVKNSEKLQETLFNNCYLYSKNKTVINEIEKLWTFVENNKNYKL